MTSQAAQRAIRVLIADDNQTNVDLAKRCFERLNCTADTASDGLRALEAMQENSYDIVFMDCQMPNLDGFDTCRRIREFPNLFKSRSSIPIVALTASATETVRDACLDAGMNDCITKPFTLDRLRRALLQWLPDVYRATEGDDAKSNDDTGLTGYMPQARVVGALDRAAIESLRLLESPSDTYGFVNLISGYFDSSRKTIDRMREAFDNGNVQGLAESAHSLKSSSANVGAVALSRLCQELESTAGHGKWADIGTLVANISEEFDKVCSMLAIEMTRSRRYQDVDATAKNAAKDDPAETVLLIDDDATQRSIAGGHLRQAGYRVEEAADGIEGIEFAREIQPDLILLDVVMPKIDGFEVCRRIRSDEILANTPIMIITGMDNTAALDRGFEAGATEFLAKPTVWNLLKYRVRFLLRRYQIEKDLRHAMSNAEAANRAKTEFLANMSHELRTPLNAILGFSEVIKDQHFGPGQHERYQEYADNIHGSGKHLLAIINDVLDMSKVASGTLDLAKEPTDFCEAIDSAVSQVDPIARKRDVTIEVSKCSARLVTVGDFRRLVQIFLNVIGNAVKFTPDGGFVRISFGTDEKDWVSIFVTDTGVGIDPDRLPEIFEPFKQLEGALSKTHEGTGLGIPIAAELTRLHGGKLSYESTPGFGTTATLRLPRKRTAKPDQHGSSALSA